MVMDATTYSSVNTRAGSSIQLNPSTRTNGDAITGFTYLNNFTVGEESNLFDIGELLDKDDNYITLAVGEQVALKVDASLSTSQTGILSPLDNLQVRFYAYSTAVGGAGNINLRYWSERGYCTAATGAVSTSSRTQSYLGFGTNIEAKPNTTLPWTLEELCSVEYVIYNSGSYPLRVYDSFIYIGGIKIQQYFSNNIRIVRS